MGSNRVTYIHSIETDLTGRVTKYGVALKKIDRLF